MSIKIDNGQPSMEDSAFRELCDRLTIARTYVHNNPTRVNHRYPTACNEVIKNLPHPVRSVVNGHNRQQP